MSSVRSLKHSQLVVQVSRFVIQGPIFSAHDDDNPTLVPQVLSLNKILFGSPPRCCIPQNQKSRLSQYQKTTPPATSSISSQYLFPHKLGRYSIIIIHRMTPKFKNFALPPPNESRPVEAYKRRQQEKSSSMCFRICACHQEITTLMMPDRTSLVHSSHSIIHIQGSL